MKYPNITKAKFVARPNRFIAQVEVNGHTETVHVKNTGRCKELLIPGCTAYLTAPDSPGRKTKYDLVAVIKDNGLLINIDSQAPNKVALKYLQTQGYDVIIPEYTYGDSRIDFYTEQKVKGGKVEKSLIEVKGCTLERNGIGYFPDAPRSVVLSTSMSLLKPRKRGIVQSWLSLFRWMESQKCDPMWRHTMSSALLGKRPKLPEWRSGS